ncbi:hypothetical protein MJO29_015993 [Puccinia striiformis f. sp. tritici]|nr:hypothetical protein MJO29_015993 [Puccinia striiformis f. sp. tritici]
MAREVVGFIDDTDTRRDKTQADDGTQHQLKQQVAQGDLIADRLSSFLITQQDVYCSRNLRNSAFPWYNSSVALGLIVCRDPPTTTSEPWSRGLVSVDTAYASQGGDVFIQTRIACYIALGFGNAAMARAKPQIWLHWRCSSWNEAVVVVLIKFPGIIITVIMKTDKENFPRGRSPTNSPKPWRRWMPQRYQNMLRPARLDCATISLNHYKSKQLRRWFRGPSLVIAMWRKRFPRGGSWSSFWCRWTLSAATSQVRSSPNRAGTMVIGWVGSGKTPTGPKPSPAESHCCPFDEAVKKLTVEQGFSAMYATLATTPATAFYQTYFTFGGNRNDPDAKGIIVDNCNCWIDSVVFDFPILYRIFISDNVFVNHATL